MTMTTPEAEHSGADKAAIRRFRANFPDSELVELRRRISATRWPERETVADQSSSRREMENEFLDRDTMSVAPGRREILIFSACNPLKSPDLEK